MKQAYSIIIATIALILTFACGAKAQFIYINPKPGSSMHQPQTNILLRHGSPLDATSLMEKDLLTITGSKSGEHAYQASLAGDGKTVIIKPDPVFDWDETITVTVKPALRSVQGKILDGTSFSFSTRKQPTAEELEKYRQANHESMIEEYGFDPSEKKSGRGPDEVYDSLTTYQILVNNNPSPGQIFYNNQNDFDSENTNCFATIIENNGEVAWARDLGGDGHDFKINYNGYLTYFNYSGLQWIMLDSNYNKIDSFQASNGYEFSTNGHDFVIYPDGHYYIIIYDMQTIDMSQYVAGGQTNASVTGLIIQGFDPAKNLVFEWRSWDHIEFTDAHSVVPLTGGIIDYVHGNSVEEDPDGNIMYSSRNCCEIVKLNTQTGDIIWRLGGEKNQFTFFNDPVPEHFRFQHDARLLLNGNITLFNNGNLQAVQQSAAKEYELDEANLTATMVWQYTHPDVNGTKVFGGASGSAQRLDNGNTLIDWGSTFTNPGSPNFTEVDMQGNIVWEFKFDTVGMKSYRAHKYEWDPCSRPTGYTMNSQVIGVNVKLKWGKATGAKKFKVAYRPVTSSTWSSLKVDQNKVTLNGLNPNTTYVWRVKTICGQGKKSDFSVIDTFITQLRLANSFEVENPLTVTVYPNPTQTELNLSIDEIGELSDQPMVITVLNAIGAEVFHKELGNTQELIHTINVSELTAGVYLLSVSIGNHQLMKKFVKQ